MEWDVDDAGVLRLPGGRLVRGRALGVGFGAEPQWGLYLLGRRPTIAWPHAWVRWPDFGLPVSSEAARAAIGEAWVRAASGRVEVACGGGVGRTGTALAAMAMLDGLDAASAVAYVREHYHPRAVETPWQRAWLRGIRTDG